MKRERTINHPKNIIGKTDRGWSWWYTKLYYRACRFPPKDHWDKTEDFSDLSYTEKKSCKTHKFISSNFFTGPWWIDSREFFLDFQFKKHYHMFVIGVQIFTLYYAFEPQRCCGQKFSTEGIVLESHLKEVRMDYLSFICPELMIKENNQIVKG